VTGLCQDENQCDRENEEAFLLIFFHMGIANVSYRNDKTSGVTLRYNQKINLRGWMMAKTLPDELKAVLG
jgi:hypothetical protein